MKNIKLAIFSSIVFLFVWTGDMLAQNVPFPESNAVWKVSQTTIAGPFFSFLALCGDTVLNGTAYSQVRALQVDSQLNIVNSFFQGSLRNDGDAVYFKPSSDDPAYLLYDFSLQAGSVISLFAPVLGEYIDRQVDSVKVENLAGQARKVIYFKPSQAGPVERWVAGIGSSFGLLGRGVEPFPDYGGQLHCFQHGTEHHNETLIECFLPQLPANCGIVNASPEPIALEPLKLTAQPNPAGPVGVRFAINQAQLPERCSLKIYAANGKLLTSVADAQPEMVLPASVPLSQGFYIATLESERTERVLAHCTFVVGEP